MELDILIKALEHCTGCLQELLLSGAIGCYWLLFGTETKNEKLCGGVLENIKMLHRCLRKILVFRGGVLKKIIVEVELKILFVRGTQKCLANKYSERKHNQGVGHQKIYSIPNIIHTISD